ncbi:hypothetical protein [Brevibacillus laterosporus]|uniref:hypothetical protein n=1 Tax=Brevibacillus laterosporus TaxID=1465 RepID=UPI00195A5C31|nr:hypothetical protein [Brevibacillus laterosporus]MBM7106869.1 hypothetical protein [Brevibacillus laterosporus]MDN9011086.1 hypothetical protein [Brevibacillus laterosporus]MDO0942109.1 hypothetical protein [Brevibacillus laterosporus]
MREITLVCMSCGSEESKIPIGKQNSFYDTFSIQCKCGKWLIENGVFAQKENHIRADFTSNQAL